MYHIPNDKRAQRSAQRLCQGLLTCLETKELQAITVSDLHQASGVSRATFYRLFDTVNDVVAYACDTLYDGLAEQLGQNPRVTFQALCVALIGQWLTLPRLMEALLKNSMIGLLLQAHTRHGDMLRALSASAGPLTAAEETYLLCTLVGLLPIMLQAWYLNGQQDTPEEIYRYLRRCVKLIDQFPDR